MLPDPPFPDCDRFQIGNVFYAYHRPSKIMYAWVGDAWAECHQTDPRDAEIARLKAKIASMDEDNRPPVHGISECPRCGEASLILDGPLKGFCMKHAQEVIESGKN